MKNKIPLIKKKVSAYLDDDLQLAISQELYEQHQQGFSDTTPGDIIRKRLREAYKIPPAKK